MCIEIVEAPILAVVSHAVSPVVSPAVSPVRSSAAATESALASKKRRLDDVVAQQQTAAQDLETEYQRIVQAQDAKIKYLQSELLARILELNADDMKQLGRRRGLSSVSHPKNILANNILERIIANGPGLD